MALGKHFSVTLTRPYRGDGSLDAARLVARLTAILSIAAGVIHLSAAGDHRSLPVMLAGFLVVGTLQVGLGALLWRSRPARLVIAAAVLLMLGSVAIWLVSRTSGLPFLRDGHMEPVGFKDGICVLFELAAIPGLLLLLSDDFGRLKLHSPRLSTQAFGVVATATCALMAPALVLEGGEHHTHEEAVALGIHGHDGETAHGYSESIHAGGSSAHATGEGHAAADGGGAHAGDSAQSHSDGVAHTGGTSHSTTELASFHTGPGGHPPGVTGGDHEEGEHRERRHSDREHGERSHRRGPDHDRDRHRGERDHGRDDPHEGHEDPEPPDDGSPLGDACAVVAAVVVVC